MKLLRDGAPLQHYWYHVPPIPPDADNKNDGFLIPCSGHMTRNVLTYVGRCRTTVLFDCTFPEAIYGKELLTFPGNEWFWKTSGKQYDEPCHGRQQYWQNVNYWCSSLFWFTSLPSSQKFHLHCSACQLWTRVYTVELLQLLLTFSC